ncbi:MAG TPA: glycosyltransferase [Jatrophihabitantaceae bacterium]|nr:glycosyltransferase [Jatrophihabitantaceae bacterium]
MRVLIVTAAMGAGHVQVASELSRRLHARGADAEVLDMISAAGPAGARLQRTYRFLLKRAPWLYDAAMRFWARVPRPLEALTAAGSHSFEDALRAAVARVRPDVIVSTYDLASQALGRLVRRGEIDAPIVTLVVDPGAHPYWVSRHVARHLVLTSLTGEQLRAYGAQGVAVVRPVLRPEFDSPPGRDAARARLGLPTGARIALVTAGSWAVGGVESTVRQLAEDRDLLVLALCGHDEQLRARLSGIERVQPVPWTPEAPTYLAAADVVIDNAGGLTCWETLASRTPVLLFRPLAGHGRFNAATLDVAGLARWVQRDDELIPAVAEAARRHGRLPDPNAPDAVDLILASAPRASTMVS